MLLLTTSELYTLIGSSF